MYSSSSKNLAHALLISARPWQWSKNVVVLAPLLFSVQLFSVHSIASGIFAFFAFCLVSGGTYLFNDIHDIEADRNHPEKQNRPLAAGDLSTTQAQIGTVVFWTLGIGVSLVLPVKTLAVVGTYIALTVAYSLVLKRIVIIDTLVIALGFVLRAVAGAFAIRVEISPWLLVCTLMLALFLGFSKRFYEQTQLGHRATAHRPNLAAYTQRLLRLLVIGTAILTLAIYTGYTMHHRTVKFFGTRQLIWSVPLVAAGLTRFLYLVLLRKQGGDAARIFLQDRWLQAVVAGWVVVVTLVIYW
jgi:4-hydroxybenzoate polyprenyltransferase